MSDGRQTPSAASISSTSLSSLATPVSESYEGLSASFKVISKEWVCLLILLIIVNMNNLGWLAF